jgi:hypothetical protein
MDLIEALQKANADLEANQQARRAMVNEFQQLVAQTKRLEMMISVLKEAVQLYGTDEGRAALAEVLDSENDWSKLNRADAVFKALASVRTPCGPSEIVQILRAHGRTDDTVNLVSAALSYLKSRYRVRSEERGKWVIRTDDDEDPDVENDGPDKESPTFVGTTQRAVKLMRDASEVPANSAITKALSGVQTAVSDAMAKGLL